MAERLFGERLRALRIASGTKTTALAAEMGIRPPKLSGIENGWERPPTPERIIKAAAFIGVEPGELLALAARDFGRYVLESVSEEHAVTAEALISRWRSLTGPELKKIRALVQA